MKKKRYLIDGSERMIVQKGVRQTVLPNPTTHSASWDAILTSDKRLFFSLCSELTTSDYAKLVEYNFDSNCIMECFYSKDYILPHERLIRDSKFHTSLAELEDGDLIMATHTTDKSPEHPAWMPEAYYASPWEGYPGSTLFRYNTKTGEVRNLGIPAPRESIYGAAYDKKNKHYYMLGYLKGHLYRYSMTDGQAVDLGQVTERSCYRLITGSDGNIYFTTRSGYLKRINTDTGAVEDLGHVLPNSCQSKHLNRSYMCAAVNGPDGRLYIAGQFHDEITAYDPKTNTLENLGSYMTADEYIVGGSNNSYVGGMDFDSKGVLWLVICGLRHDRGEDFRPAATLIRWDISKGEEPCCLGIPGTPKRATTITSGVFIDKNKDIFYIVGSSHGHESTDVTAITLEEFSKHLEEAGPVPEDPYLAPGCETYREHGESIENNNSILDTNPAQLIAKKIIPIRLWREVPYQEVEDSAVRSLHWEGELLKGICGTKNYYTFTIDKMGRLLKFESIDNFKKDVELIPDMLKSLCYPYYPGRQYKAYAHKATELDEGGWLVATGDGLLCRVRDNKIFSLGPVCSHGAVHNMTLCSEEKTVYGVAGDKEDLGCIFKYDDATGLQNLGRLTTDGWEYGSATSCNLSCCSISGNILAVGAEDRLGCVYLCLL